MSAAPRRLKMFRYFGSTVVSRVLISAANFLAGLLLIRNVPDAAYGYYVLAITTLLLFSGVQASFINGPLAVLAPLRDASGAC